jgi:hypothetical protein
MNTTHQAHAPIRGHSALLAARQTQPGDLQEKRIGQIYLTAMIAAVPVAVATMLAATPSASPTNVPLSFNAALQNAPPVEVVPPLAPCRKPINGDVQPGCRNRRPAAPPRAGAGQDTASPPAGAGQDAASPPAGAGPKKASTGGGPPPLRPAPPKSEPQPPEPMHPGIDGIDRDPVANAPS